MEDFTRHHAKTDPSSVIYARETEGGGFEMRDEDGNSLGVAPSDVFWELFEPAELSKGER